MPKRTSYGFRKSGGKVYIGGKGRNWQSLRSDAKTAEPLVSLAAWKKVAGRGVDYPGLDDGPSSFFGRKTTRARKGRVVGRVYSAKSRKVLGSIGGKRTKRGGGGGGGKKKASKACQSLDWLVKANVKKKV
ncbi:MAG TPA: hypothetical protein VJ327_03240 [Patescibacteria group bacterium]|nr:hypothetical protein [Patescibacteria group bacterium]